MNIDNFRQPPYKCIDCKEESNCSRHECNCCGTCEGTLYFFGEELDFSLCSDCLISIQTQIQKGLTKIEQAKHETIVFESIDVLRKTITEETRKVVFDRDNWQCVFCGSSEKLEVDHIFPFSKGGTTDINNLQTLCKTCNCKKRDKIL